MTNSRRRWTAAEDAVITRTDIWPDDMLQLLAEMGCPRTSQAVAKRRHALKCPALKRWRAGNFDAINAARQQAAGRRQAAATTEALDRVASDPVADMILRCGPTTPICRWRRWRAGATRR